MLAGTLLPKFRLAPAGQPLLRGLQQAAAPLHTRSTSFAAQPATTSAESRAPPASSEPPQPSTELRSTEDGSFDNLSEPPATTLSNLRPEEWLKIKPLAEDLVEIGVFGTPHGIRGTVRLRHTIEEGRDWCRRRGPRWLLPPLKAEDAAPDPVIIGGCKTTRNQGKKIFIARIMTCTTQEEAHAFRNKRLMMLREEFEGEQDDEESYPAEKVIGLQVHMLRQAEGDFEHIGHVVSVHEGMGEHDNLMIQLKDKDLGFMLPFANALVPDVDFEGGRIMITPPAGILDCAIPLARASEAPE